MDDYRMEKFENPKQMSIYLEDFSHIGSNGAYELYFNSIARLAVVDWSRLEIRFFNELSKWEVQ